MEMFPQKVVETMIVNKASKCRLYPTKEQQNNINKTLGCCRYIYNKMLERQIKMYKRRKDHLSYNEMQNLLPIMKNYLPWLKEADSQALKYACRQLDNSYQRFFKGQGGFPKYKRRKDKQSYTTTNASTIHIEIASARNGKIKLPTLGWVKVRGLNLPDDYIVTKATVNHDPDGKYYVSIAYKTGVDIPIVPLNKETVTAIGIDFREGDLYCDSNGISAGKPNNIMESMDKLKKTQDKLSRLIESHIIDYKVVGNKRYPVYDKPLRDCKNIQNQRRRIARIHKHIANQRLDFLHKQSAAITKQYDVICIEDLRVQDMIIRKDEDPSAIKRYNINRKVYDDGWYMFTQMLSYKASWQSKHLVKVDKDFQSTQMCSHCGHIEPSISNLTVRQWDCPKCGSHHGRDRNAAINIKNEGLRILRQTA